MDCAAMMRALQNDGMSGAPKNGLASGLKHNMVGVHMQVLGPMFGNNGVLKPCGGGARHGMPSH